MFLPLVLTVSPGSTCPPTKQKFKQNEFFNFQMDGHQDIILYFSGGTRAAPPPPSPTSSSSTRQSQLIILLFAFKIIVKKLKVCFKVTFSLQTPVWDSRFLQMYSPYMYMYLKHFIPNQGCTFPECVTQCTCSNQKMCANVRTCQAAVKTVDHVVHVPGGTHTLGNVRICSGRLVSSTRPSDV